SDVCSSDLDREASRSWASRQGLTQVHKAGPWTARLRSASKGYYPQKEIFSCRPIFNRTIGRICPSPSVLQMDPLQQQSNRPVRVTAVCALALAREPDAEIGSTH